MYLRSTPRRDKDGSEVRYLQLAHNVWDPKVQVVYNFGREDATSRDALQRLVALVTRFLDPAAAPAATTEGLEFTESRPLGGTWVLDALWSRLGIGPAMRKLLKGAAWMIPPSGCCSRWSRTERWPRRPSWPPPAGPAATS